MKNLINREILKRYKEILLIHNNESNTISTREALRLADELELDLVLVSGNSNPVCKIMDFGKYQYQKKKQKKPQKTANKSVRLGLDTGPNDLLTKAKQVVKFLNKGSSVDIQLRIRKRIDLKRKDRGMSKIQEFYSIVEEQFEKQIKTSRPKYNSRSWSGKIEL